MTRRYCCYLEGGKADGKPCDEKAEWELHGISHPMEPTDACTAHVGMLLDDSPETLIFPIAE